MFDSLWGAQSQDSADNYKLLKKKKKKKKKTRSEESNRLPPLTSLTPTPSRWAKMVDSVLVLSDFAKFVPHK